MNEQQQKFEAWTKEKYYFADVRGEAPNDGPWYYFDDDMNSAWDAWQAAIASQAPRQALSDAEIARFWKESGKHGGDTTSEMVKHFARAILAASGPNAALVEALKAMVTDFDGCYAEAEPAMIKARAALAAVGEEP